ncbi:MAG: hypothetical protein B6I19_01330 [Bacteroidetes bacterium 4572_114]|nr:MAG: hypothetical protein B6I19_01330 [Bacteroidetes bacterium 4572_114]
MIKAIIVEDEPYSCEHLASLLSGFCSNVELVGMAHDVKSGYELISKINPDLVLLDIEMPDGTGFDLLQKFAKIKFEIIFTTAFAEYAVKAFQFSAIHYLLKPIDPEGLVSAINKAEDELERKNIETRVNALYFNLQNQAGKGKKVVLSSGTKLYVIDSNEIIMCLKEYDDLLVTYGFFRVHKQYLINIDYIKSFDRAGGGAVNLSNGLKIPVAELLKRQ